MKRSLIFCLLLVMLFAFSAPIVAEEVTPAADSDFYTVLVVDTSGSHTFSSGGTDIYTAESAIDQVKSAATAFTEALLDLDANHKIAIVSYKEYATTVTNFTSDSAQLKKDIAQLTASGSVASITRGLSRAGELLDKISDTNTTKNVVLFTTGFNNEGKHSYSGLYNSSTPGSTWYRDKNGNGKQNSNEYHLYAYANSAYAESLDLRNKANIHTIGLFQNWEGMPQAGQELVTFFKMFTEDLASPRTNYVPVYSKNAISNGFGQVCNNIINNPFRDVTYEQYYFKAVLWAKENGITLGMDWNAFDPESTCTREQMVTFLWRAEGKKSPAITTTPFWDVVAGTYSYDAILWATEDGVTKGTSATTFSPTDTVTREQVVTFLWRIAGEPTSSVKSPFRDITPANYSYNAICWAVENGITFGITPTTFGPQEPCTRGQIVTFLYRYYAE